MLFLILFAFFFPQIASPLNFNWWAQHPQKHHEAIKNTIQKCCPKYDGTSKPIFCCADELFDKAPEFPQQMCKDDNVEMTSVFTTINCAQTEFHRQTGRAHAPTDICRNYCCDFLMNVQGAVKETACSRKCAIASFAIGKSVNRQLTELRKMGCGAAKTQFAALEDCLKGPAQYFNDIRRSSSKSANDDGEEEDVEMAKMKALNEVCRQRAEEEQNS